MIKKLLFLLLTFTVLYSETSHVYWELIPNQDSYGNGAPFFNDFIDCIETTDGSFDSDSSYYLCLSRYNADSGNSKIGLSKITKEGILFATSIVEIGYQNNYPRKLDISDSGYVYITVANDNGYYLVQTNHEAQIFNITSLTEVFNGAGSALNPGESDLLVNGEDVYISTKVYSGVNNEYDGCILKFNQDQELEWIYRENQHFILNQSYQSNRIVDVYINDNNEILFRGNFETGSNLIFIGKLDSNGNRIWLNGGSDSNYFQNQGGTLLELSNGNIINVGSTLEKLTIDILHSDGALINTKIFSNYLEFPYLNEVKVRDAILTLDENIIITGRCKFENQNQFGQEGFILKINQDFEIEWLNQFGASIWNEQLWSLFLDSNNAIVASGEGTNQNGQQTGALLKISSSNGCTNQQSCNYNQFSDYDDGSCWNPLDSCTCDEPEGSLDDECGECNGNGYDTCDDDGDGTSNYNQWGYGAYNIELEDIPNDYGGGLYMTFNKSFYDNNDANRNEFYTIERLDENGWVSLNSISAYNQDTYTTEVSTQFDGVETEFRIIATMDEGTFISTTNGSGTSIDNLTILGCMDVEACNYTSQATLDDGTCEYPEGTCDCFGIPTDGYCACEGETIDACGDCTLNPLDTDTDTIPDTCDNCPNDPDNDADGDGVCGDVDICEGYDDNLDTDGDTIVDCLEIGGCTNQEACNYSDTATDDDGTCFLGYTFCIDIDQDGLGDPAFCYTSCDNPIPNDGFVDNSDDLCPNDTTNDTDGDEICDSDDLCPEDSDNDIDGDGLCFVDDACPNDPDNDADGDGVCGDVDICEGYDDNLDTDGDTIVDCLEIGGCTNQEACNYSDTATDDDGSCVYASESCDCDQNPDDGFCGCNGEIFDCSGSCLLEIDENFQSLDACGICGGDNIDFGDYLEGPDVDCSGVCFGDDYDCGGSCGQYEVDCTGACIDMFDPEQDFQSLDACGICGGDNIDFGDYLEGPDVDCSGVCFGDAQLDLCGDCEGENLSCSGCTDEMANNYDETAIIEDGSCDYASEFSDPNIESIVDIPNDQGGFVGIQYEASIYDHMNYGFDITHYSFWRELDVEEDGRPEYWELVGQMAAQNFQYYGYTAPTLIDSTDAGLYYSTFKVIAHTPDSEVYFESEPMSGYSTDDLAPSVPANFIAEILDEYNVQLIWNKVPEEDLEYYSLYRSEESNFDPSILEPLATLSDTAYVDINAGQNEYYYKIASTDFSGNQSVYSDEIYVNLLEIAEPLEFSLKGCYPNPFNPTTTIGYDVSSISNVNISIYNTNGQLVDVLADRIHEPGEYSIVWNAQGYTSGVYIVKLIAGEFVDTQKMMLIK